MLTHHLTESALLPALMKLPNVSVCALGTPPAILRSKSAPFIITGPAKVLWQVFNLFHVLLYKTQPAQWLLVQVCLLHPGTCKDPATITHKFFRIRPRYRPWLWRG